MRVAKIHFNHDPTSSTSDAINLRTNADSAPITDPEWVNGSTPSPVAYASSALSGPITIKVWFTGGPLGKSVTIRAVVGLRKSRGIRGIPQAIPFSPLGGVHPRTVTFDQEGNSAVLFEVEDLPVGAGKWVFTWTWQVFGAQEWFNVTTSQHLIYVVPALPKPPWTQDPMDPDGWSLPWPSALDKACWWAAGTIFPNEAAAAIVRAINDLPGQQYKEKGTLATLDEFHLTEYLHNIDTGQLFSMNCRDVATAVITFANLLGADLWPLTLKTGFTTKPVRALSDAMTTTPTWGFHEVAAPAWSLPSGWQAEVELVEGPALDEAVRVYDGCVHIGSDVLPIDMPFGSVQVSGSHRFELIDPTLTDMFHPGTGRPSRPRHRRRVI
jgi:hypothetical protein